MSTRNQHGNTESVFQFRACVKKDKTSCTHAAAVSGVVVRTPIAKGLGKVSCDSGWIWPPLSVSTTYVGGVQLNQPLVDVVAADQDYQAVDVVAADQDYQAPLLSLDIYLPDLKGRIIKQYFEVRKQKNLCRMGIPCSGMYSCDLVGDLPNLYLASRAEFPANFILLYNRCLEAVPEGVHDTRRVGTRPPIFRPRGSAAAPLGLVADHASSAGIFGTSCRSRCGPRAGHPARA